VTAVAFGIQGSGQLVGGAPDPARFREVAVRAEELGYDSIWAGDHISYCNPILDVVYVSGGRVVLGVGVWIPISVSAERFADGLAELPESVTPAVTLPAHVGDRRRLYEHLRARYSGDFTEHVVDRYCVAGTLEQCVARVRAYVDAGAQHIVFNILELDDAQRLVEVARAAAG
jgi:alkanesulfonate monooxygenase SsuD/methylene tetrahydromethanopterin reductase-like flavin-dependent oxidoreductase (luciferase family)